MHWNIVFETLEKESLNSILGTVGKVVKQEAPLDKQIISKTPTNTFSLKVRYSVEIKDLAPSETVTLAAQNSSRV